MPTVMMFSKNPLVWPHLPGPCVLCIWVVCLLLWAPQLLDAQEPKDLLQEAEDLIEREQYQQALGALKLVAQLQDLNNEQKWWLGACLYKTGDPAAALPYLQEHLKANKPEPTAFLYRARCVHSLHRFQEAANFYKDALRALDTKDPRRASIKTDILRCDFGRRTQRLERIAFVDNLGPAVNSKNHDLAPILSPNYSDRLYFASNRDGVEGGLRNRQGYEDPTGQLNTDLFVTGQEELGWTPAQRMPLLINSSSNDLILDFNSDGTVLYYFKGFHLQKGRILTDTFSADGTVSLRSNRFPAPVRAEIGETDLCIFQDTLLLFSGRRPEGFGGLDLYFSLRKNGKWTAPQNLGPTVNTPYDERHPWLAADGKRLFFSTNAPDRSMGGQDILLAVFDEGSATWLAPQNLGLPINSAAEEGWFRLAPDGIKAYFASDRHSGIGGWDLYQAFFKQPQPYQQRTAELHFAACLERGPLEPQLSSDTSEIAYSFRKLFFDNEGDLTQGRNAQVLESIANVMKNYPDLQLSIRSHSDEIENPLQYDLYFSAKRGEKVRDFLIQQGIARERLHVMALGAQYPIALAELEGQDNPAGRALNRRIDFGFFQKEPGRLTLSVEAPIVSTFMQASEGESLRNNLIGLSYRIEVAVAGGPFNQPAYVTLPDLCIEIPESVGQYHYTAGLFNNYSDARAFRDKVGKQNFPKTIIQPYVNGIRLNQEQITRLLDDYPDLIRFVADQ